MRESIKFRMWSADSVDLKNIDLVLDHQQIIKTGPNFEPNPYVFAKFENGKKLAADPTSFTPPSWLLLDHSIAVIWSLFSLNPSMQHLSIDDLKWAYEFLKEIKNKKGENPPDVKICLQEIQDRLIDLYAKLTLLKKEDFGEIATSLGEKIMEDSTSKYVNAYVENNVESKLDMLSACKKSPSTYVQDYNPSKDITGTKSTKALLNSSKTPCYILENDLNLYDNKEQSDDEDVEKYVLTLLEADKKKSLQSKPSTKSFIPTKKKATSVALSEAVSCQDAFDDATKKEKTSKRVHCVAEMRSLKFQKSTKVTDTNGEEAAYSNLKAEIQRLTINPDVSKNEVMKFLKDWRSEQVKRLDNELKRLGNIEEFMKNLNSEEVKPNNRLSLKALGMEKSK